MLNASGPPPKPQLITGTQTPPPPSSLWQEWLPARGFSAALLLSSVAAQRRLCSPEEELWMQNINCHGMFPSAEGMCVCVRTHTCTSKHYSAVTKVLCRNDSAARFCSFGSDCCSAHFVFVLAWLSVRASVRVSVCVCLSREIPPLLGVTNTLRLSAGVT